MPPRAVPGPASQGPVRAVGELRTLLPRNLGLTGHWVCSGRDAFAVRIHWSCRSSGRRLVVEVAEFGSAPLIEKMVKGGRPEFSASFRGGGGIKVRDLRCDKVWQTTLIEV